MHSKLDFINSQRQTHRKQKIGRRFQIAIVTIWFLVGKVFLSAVVVVIRFCVATFWWWIHCDSGDYYANPAK